MYTWREAMASDSGPSAPGRLSPGCGSKRDAIQPLSFFENESASRGFNFRIWPSMPIETGRAGEYFGCRTRDNVKASRLFVVISSWLIPVNLASIEASAPGVSPSSATQYAELYLKAELTKRMRSG